MNITLSPQRRDDSLNVSKSGDTLTINGVDYDFSVIPDGATLPASAVDCAFFTGEIQRVDGDLRLSLVLPHGTNPSQAAAFPAPLINPADGVLDLPK